MSSSTASTTPSSTPGSALSSAVAFTAGRVALVAGAVVILVLVALNFTMRLRRRGHETVYRAAIRIERPPPPPDPPRFWEKTLAPPRAGARVADMQPLALAREDDAHGEKSALVWVPVVMPAPQDGWETAQQLPELVLGAVSPRVLGALQDKSASNG